MSRPLSNPAPISGFAPWEDPDARPIVQFDNVSKVFGDFTAVDRLNLSIYEREFFALLGPSGCGKTTLMRMLAGFEQPTEGRILLNGQDIAKLPPNKRPINMMFQSYALFPHMSVEKNVGFGLVQEGRPQTEVAQQVEKMLALVQLSQFAKRKPHQLSGGQRQRVALARALAKRPRILLLDEPLAALDKKLRDETQFELMSIQEELGITFLIVTHDQEEAMTVASRIAVMKEGQLLQVATPGAIYEHPNSRFVADFIGDINLIAIDVTALSDGVISASWGGSTRPLRIAADDKQARYLALRPEKLNIAKQEPEEADNAVQGKVVDIAYTGALSTYHVELQDGTLLKSVQANTVNRIGRPITWEDQVWLSWSRDAGVVLAS